MHRRTERRATTGVQSVHGGAVMSTDNVTPIKPDEWPPGLKDALNEQQRRVWRLRNMIEAVNRAGEGGEVEDISAALDGATDYADLIHMDLDAGALMKRAND